MAFGRRVGGVKKRYEAMLYQPIPGWNEELLDNGVLLITQPDSYNYIFIEFLQDNSAGRTLSASVDDLVMNHREAKQDVLLHNSGVTRTQSGIEHGFFSYTFTDNAQERLREVNIVMPVPGGNGNTLFITMAAPERDYLLVEPILQKFLEDVELV